MSATGSGGSRDARATGHRASALLRDHRLATGYRKDYEYNDRLRYREPPYFLDPVQASWRVARQNEQVPATAEPEQ